MRSFGWEIEFLLVKNGEFVDWSGTLERLSRELRAEYPKGLLYRDATPCPEWASQPETDYEKLFEQVQHVFQKIKEKTGGHIIFIGGASTVRSTFSGHIHVGTPKGLTRKKINEMLKTLHGSQTLMELMSQNFKLISAGMADARARTRRYYKYYELVKGDYPPTREYWNYTWNEHKTVENRIPPSSDFYHLLTLTMVENAWLNHFKDSMTYDWSENFSEATQKGEDGIYMIEFNGHVFLVDYSTYITFQLARIEDELKEEMSKVNPKIRNEIKKYIEFLKRKTLASHLALKSLRELSQMSENLIERGKSYLEDVRIVELKTPKRKFTEKNIASVIQRINSSKEVRTFERFRAFLEAMKTLDLSKANPEDLPIIEKVIAKKQLKELI